MQIVELGAAGVERHAEELAQLLLDAHASNMALGLSAPLTRDAAVETWRRFTGVVLAALEDGAVVGAVHLARATTPNGTHRGEVQKLAVRADRRGAGIGGALLDAVAERARADGLSLLWLTTHADTASDAFYAARGWQRAGVVPAWSRRPDGTLAANAFFYLPLSGMTTG